VRTFEPRLDVLPETQLRLWPELKQVPPRFVLYGGTAITLRLGHRRSVDFDFFSTDPFEPEELFQSIPMLSGARRLQSRRNTLSVELDRNGSVELSFFGGLTLGRVGEPEATSDQVSRVASSLDLAGMKAAVVQQRALRKDYLDMAALLRSGIRLVDALGAAQALYRDRFNPMITLKALSYFADGDLPKLPEDVKQFLSEQASRVAAIPAMARVSDHIAPEP
jgi:hypothetical protein